MVGNALIVEGMTQFVRQRHHISQRSVKIRQNPALTDAAYAAAKSAACLAAAGVEVNPFFVKGTGDHTAEFIVKMGEQLHQVIPGILGGKTGGAFAHGGKQVIPGQPILIAQGVRLGFQIAAEHWELLVDGGKHGIQGLLFHVGLLQRPCQRAFIAPQLTFIQRFQLQGIKSIGNAVFNGTVAGKLRFVSILAYLRLGGIGQIADGGEVNFLAPVSDLHRAGQVLLQFRPGIGAGNLQLCHHLFANAWQQMETSQLFAFQNKAVFFKKRIRRNQTVQIRDCCQPAFKGGNRRSAVAVDPHDFADFGTGFRIGGAGCLAQLGIAQELFSQLLQMLL